MVGTTVKISDCSEGDLINFSERGSDYTISNIRQPPGVTGSIIADFTVVRASKAWIGTEGRVYNETYPKATRVNLIKKASAKEETGMNELQERVWQYLLSGRGDIEKRRLALKMLSEDGFFITGFNSEASADALKELVGKSRYVAAFCDGGINRVLELIKPKNQQRARIVIEMDVTPSKGVCAIFDVTADDKLASLPQVKTVLEGLMANKDGLSFATRTINNVELVSIEEVK